LECRQNFSRWADRCRIVQKLSFCRSEQTLFAAITLATTTISKLPWGNDAFTIKRYRISKRENFELVEEKSRPAEALN